MQKTEAIFLSLGILALPATANATTVQNISAHEAEKGVAPVINICNHQGYNLSFLDVPGGITSARVVDPSRVHVGTDSPELGPDSPAKVVYLRRINPINFPQLPQSDKPTPTTLSVQTTSRKLYRFKVGYACPSNYDTGILGGLEIADSRQRKFRPRVAEPKLEQDQASKPKPVEPTKVDEVLKPKKVAKVDKPDIDQVNQDLRFQRQQEELQELQAKIAALEQLPERKEKPQEAEAPKPPEVKVEHPQLTQKQKTDFWFNLSAESAVKGPTAPPQALIQAQSQEKATPQKVAWHLTRGLNSARVRGEINYGTSTYRQWHSVIRDVRRGNSLASSIQKHKADPVVGGILLKYGGLN